MKVIVWGINYMPEMTGIAPYNTALCEFLVERGWSADMVTAFAYYPEWRKREEDWGKLYRTDHANGVRIHRCWAYVPSRVSALRRMVHEGSFVFMSLLRVLCMKRPSIFVVVSPPLLLGLAAWIASTVKNAPFVFHVQDLQPDAAVGLGMLKVGLFTKLLYWLEGMAYAKAAKVSGISEGMLQMFRKKGVPEEKLVLFPNGVRLAANLTERGRFRVKHHVSEDVFLAVYSGNLGIKQGLDVLIDAAKELAGSGQGASPLRILIVIAGDGARRAILAERIAHAALDNVLLLPLQPEKEYREMLSDADCTVITQQHGTGSFFFPSKLLASLALARPVLTVADDESELAKAVRTGNFGVNVTPNRPDRLAEALRMFAATRENIGMEARGILKMEEINPISLSKMGEAGLKFAEPFEMRRVLEAFALQLESVVEATSVQSDVGAGNVANEEASD